VGACLNSPRRDCVLLVNKDYWALRSARRIWS